MKRVNFLQILAVFLMAAMLLTGCASLADVREHIIYRG